MNLADLKAPFVPSKISWRVGPTNAGKTKGIALAYIDARDVQDRLDEVCGVEGWQCRYVPMHDKKTVCEIGIRIQRGIEITAQAPEGAARYPGVYEWVWKSDGAGDSDIEAEKGSLSDAFKRAAVRWGIGRYLYDVEPPWVAIEPAGRSFKIALPEYVRLEALLAGKQKPTQHEAIHGDSTLNPKPLPPPPPISGTLTPQAWAQMGIGRVNGFKTLQDLDAFEKKFTAKIAQLAPLVPDLHAGLVTAMADKRFILEAQ